jgi:hypothetical protein
MKSSFEVIQEEVDAFNAGDLERFLSMFTSDVVVDGLATATAPIVGAEALREQYGRRMAQSGIRARIESRVCLGQWVIDYEFVSVESTVVPQLAIYELRGEKIARVTILRTTTTADAHT